jgi:hypothetical protein
MSNITAVLPNAQVYIPHLNVKYLVSFLLLTASLAFTQAPPPVVQNDFEDGTVQGWIPRGTAMLSNTTEAARTEVTALKPSAAPPASMGQAWTL